MCHVSHSSRKEVRKFMMKRTISGMIGAGSLAHNRRDFIAENVDPDRVQLNICYRNENLKEVYKELFDEAVERYNVGKRKDRQITNYYEKIRQGKQEKLFHEVIFQIGNREDMAVGTVEGDMAVKVLDEYVKDFQKRNPTLRVFGCYLHQDESTPHLHIDFIPYVTDWKGKGMDTRVSLKQALKSLGFQGGNKHDTELNQWINHEKEVLAETAKQYGIEWEQKGTHEEHLDVYNFKKKERKKEVQELEQKNKVQQDNGQRNEVKQSVPEGKVFYSSVAYLQSTDDTSRLDALREKGDYEGLLRLAKEYYDGDGINEQYTFVSPRQNKGDDLLIEDKDFAVIYNNSVGGTYEVMLKYSEQEIRDHITRYGVRLASSDIKEVAKDMAVEQFSAMTKQRTPVLEMPNGDILHIGYNRDADTLDVGTATNAGLAISHSFPYDHDNSLDSNLQSVHSELSQMEQYQEEEVEYSGGMHR